MREKKISFYESEKRINEISSLNDGIYKIYSRLTSKFITVMMKKNNQYYIIGELFSYTEEEIYKRFIYTNFVEIKQQ